MGEADRRPTPPQAEPSGCDWRDRILDPGTLAKVTRHLPVVKIRQTSLSTTTLCVALLAVATIVVTEANAQIRLIGGSGLPTVVVASGADTTPLTPLDVLLRSAKRLMQGLAEEGEGEGAVASNQAPMGPEPTLPALGGGNAADNEKLKPRLRVRRPQEYDKSRAKPYLAAHHKNVLKLPTDGSQRGRARDEADPFGRVYISMGVQNPAAFKTLSDPLGNPPISVGEGQRKASGELSCCGVLRPDPYVVRHGSGHRRIGKTL